MASIESIRKSAEHKIEWLEAEEKAALKDTKSDAADLIGDFARDIRKNRDLSVEDKLERYEQLLDDVEKERKYYEESCDSIEEKKKMVYDEAKRKMSSLHAGVSSALEVEMKKTVADEESVEKMTRKKMKLETDAAALPDTYKMTMENGSLSPKVPLSPTIKEVLQDAEKRVVGAMVDSYVVFGNSGQEKMAAIDSFVEEAGKDFPGLFHFELARQKTALFEDLCKQIEDIDASHSANEVRSKVIIDHAYDEAKRNISSLRSKALVFF